LEFAALEHDYSVAITVSYWHLEARYFMVEPSLLGWVFHIIDDASNRSRPFGALASAALSKLIRPVGFSRWPTWKRVRENWNTSRLSFVGWEPLR
jgi:hypothetical protein